MTIWPLKTTLQRPHHHAGLHCTTSGRSGLSRWSMLYNFLARLLTCTIKPLLMIQKAASSMIGLKRVQESPCHTSPPLCTGYRMQLASCSRHWCLHTEQLSALHPPRLLPPFTLMRLYPLQKLEICKWAMPHGTITVRNKITFQNVFVHYSLLVEWSSPPHLTHIISSRIYYLWWITFCMSHFIITLDKSVC